MSNLLIEKMSNKKFIREFLRRKYPVGTEIYDHTRNGGPYIIKKYTVFEIHPWTKDDYNPDFLPDNPDDYHIDFIVRNPGSDTTYSLESSSINDIKWMNKFWEEQKERDIQREIERANKERLDKIEQERLETKKRRKFNKFVSKIYSGAQEGTMGKNIFKVEIEKFMKEF